MADASQHTESDQVAPTRGGRASSGGYGRIFVRAVRRSIQDHVPNLAQAVAFNTFLAIPSGLLVALGVFTLVASPSDVSTLISHLRGVVPASVIQLLNQSLERARENGGGVAMIAVGAVIALWSLTSAMTTIQWAINLAYEHETRRGFVRTRLAALGMVACILVAFGLVVVLQVLGPVMTAWLGSTLGIPGAINWIWWIAQWPVLVGGLLAAFAGILFLGPDIDRRR
jgi:membrane protein